MDTGDKIDQVAKGIEAANRIADNLRTVQGLRDRAARAHVNATTVHRRHPLRRLFWTWRANKLAQMAVDLERRRED